VKSLGLILIAVILGSIGQIFFKAGVKGVKISFNLSIIKIFLTPYVLSGLFCYALSTAVFLKVLSQEKLSYAYPMISLTYPIVLLLSYFIFKESIPVWRWFGILLIMIGVYFVGR
jgi:uncharacterized membrane protein